MRPAAPQRCAHEEHEEARTARLSRLWGGGAVRQDTHKRAPEPAAATPAAFDVTEAKLFRPPVRPGIVRRNTLVERLRNAETASVVAITAPAGYGKTTLLAEWAERDRRPFAWISVDEADGDPVVFLGHVAVALDRIEPIEPSVLESIASPTGANSARVLSRLSSALATRTRPFVLVLDDLDRLAEPSVMDAVSTIAGSVPEGSALALATRAVPNVGLPRLRADGRLVEVGVEDLTLGPPQAYRLLRGAGVRATKIEAAELTDATEGWPVGLYLAALSLQEQRRSTVPPIRFTGDDRFVVDYVRSEVLARLSRERQRFLTRTSILDRLNGSLCDAVMERSGSLVPSSRSSDRTCSWCRSIGSGSGTGTTTSSATCSAPSSGANPKRSRAASARRGPVRGSGHARGGVRACARERR